MVDAYELATADTLEEVMERQTDDFNSLKTEELQTQWKHKISVVPESEGITTKWWTYTDGVSRVGPEAQVPAGETITTDQSGDYTVGTPALAGGAARLEGDVVQGDGDDWWSGYTNRLGDQNASEDDGVGIGYKYFAEGEGFGNGAEEAGGQEYVWFSSGVAGVDDQIVPRDQWNGDDLSEFDADLSSLFHRTGFVRIDHTFYNQGSADVSWGVKTSDGKIDIVTLHSFNFSNNPMWSDSDLKWQMATEGVNLTGYINAAHYKGGNGDRLIRYSGTGRDGTVLGSGLGEVTTGAPVPVISIMVRTGWENINATPVDCRIEMDGSFYLFVATNAILDGTENFRAPNSEAPTIDPSGSEYALLADNEAQGFSDIGEVEVFKFINSSGQGNQTSAAVSGTLPDFSLSAGEVAVMGVVPIDATTFYGASLEWGSNF
jgi:hypothetical protein